MEDLTRAEGIALAKKFLLINNIQKVVSKELLETIDSHYVQGRSVYHNANESGNGDHSGWNEEVYINSTFIEYQYKSWNLKGEHTELFYLIGWDGKVLANLTGEPVTLMIKGEKVELMNCPLYCTNTTETSEFIGMEFMESSPVLESDLPVYTEGITYLVGPVIRRFFNQRWDFVSPINGKVGEDLVIIGLY